MCHHSFTVTSCNRSWILKKSPITIPARANLSGPSRPFFPHCSARWRPRLRDIVTAPKWLVAGNEYNNQSTSRTIPHDRTLTSPEINCRLHNVLFWHLISPFQIRRSPLNSLCDLNINNKPFFSLKNLVIVTDWSYSIHTFLYSTVVWQVINFLARWTILQMQGKEEISEVLACGWNVRHFPTRQTSEKLASHGCAATSKQ